MSVIHRVLFTWFTVVVFLILLVLRLDGRTQWNWFIVFIPVWIFDEILFVYGTFEVFTQCKNNGILHYLYLDAYFFLGVFLKLCFEVILCLKLEYPHLNYTAFHVLIPVWIILPLVCIHIAYKLVSYVNDFM